MTTQPTEEQIQAALRTVTCGTGPAYEILAAALAASRRDSARLDWLERFLQMGGASVSTTHESQKRDREDDTAETKWNNPFSIGYTVEVEHRGCYEWREKSNGAKGIRPAIDAAQAAIDAASKGATG